MTYDPTAYDSDERSHLYKWMWFGAGCAVFSAANLFIGMDNMLSATAFGGMAGGPLTVAFGTRADEYMKSLQMMGLRWMCACLGVYLIALFILANGDVAHDLGMILGGAESDDEPSSTQLIATNGLIVAVALSISFYAGYAFAWARDTIGADK